MRHKATELDTLEENKLVYKPVLTDILMQT